MRSRSCWQSWAIAQLKNWDATQQRIFQRTTIARWNMSARIAAKLRSHWLLGTLSGKDTEVGRSENSSFPLKDPSGWLVGFRTLFHSELFKEMEHAAPNIQKT